MNLRYFFSGSIFRIIILLFASLIFSILIEFFICQKNFYLLKSNDVFYSDYSVVLEHLDSANLISDGNGISSGSPLVLNNDSYSFFRGLYFEFENFDSRHIYIKIYCSDENGKFSEDFVRGRVSIRKKRGYIPLGQYSKNLKIFIGNDDSKYSLNSIIINPNLYTVVNNLDQTRILRITALCFLFSLCYYFKQRLKLIVLYIFSYWQKLEKLYNCEYYIVLIITHLVLFFFFIHSFSLYYSLVNLYIPDNIYHLFYFLLLVLAAYKLVSMLRDKNIIIASVSVISLSLLYAVYFVSKSERFIYEFVLLLICCYKFSYKRIFFIYVLAIGLIISSEIILMLTGVIKDIAYLKYTGEYRHSFGSIYPTDFACSILFVCLALWAILKKVYCFICIASLVTLIYFQLLFTHTRNTEVVMCICLVLIVLYSFFRDKTNIICQLKLFTLPLKFSFVFLALVSITLGYLYDSSNSLLENLNSLLSERLSLVHSALNNYGITWLGQHIVLVGNGGSLVFNEGYNFIDSSYCLLLIRYGFICFVIFAAMYTYTQKRVLAGGNLKLSLVILLVAIHSFTEHHYTEFFYNPCLLLLFADVKDLKTDEQVAAGNC